MHNFRSLAVAAFGLTLPLVVHLAFAQTPPTGNPEPPPPPGGVPAAPSGVAPPSSAPTTPAPGTTAPGAPTAPVGSSEAPPPSSPQPPKAAAPTAPAGLAPQPAATTPTLQPAATGPGLAPEKDRAEPKAKPLESAIGIEAMLGIGGRLDSTSSGYTDEGRAGLLIGGGAFYAPNRQYALGLSYQRMSGGTEQFNPGPNQVTGRLARVNQSLLANVRFYPLRNDAFGLWGGLVFGATWQTATANGSLVQASVSGFPPTYKVDAGPNAGVALGAAVGIDVEAGNNVAFLSSLNLMSHFLSSDSMTSPPDPPVPGSGSIVSLDWRIAFQYRFDVPGMNPPTKAAIQASLR